MNVFLLSIRAWAEQLPDCSILIGTVAESSAGASVTTGSAGETALIRSSTLPLIWVIVRASSDSWRRSSIVPSTAGSPAAVVEAVHVSPKRSSPAHLSRCSWHERPYTLGRIARSSSMGTATTTGGAPSIEALPTATAAPSGGELSGRRRIAAHGGALADPDVERDAGRDLCGSDVRVLVRDPRPLQAEVVELHRRRGSVRGLDADEALDLVFAVLLEGRPEPGQLRRLWLLGGAANPTSGATADARGHGEDDEQGGDGRVPS